MNFRKIKPAKRTNNIKYAIRDIVVYAKKIEKEHNKKMYWLNIGDPNIFDFSTPKDVLNLTIEAMNNNNNGYAPSSGIDDAVKSIKEDFISKGVKNIQDIFVTTGASEAIDISLTALLNKGENFLVPAPTYPLYNAIINKLEAEVNSYYLDEDNNWEPDIKDIETKVNSKTKGILLINPNNPTGTNYSKESLKKVIALAKKYNLIIFSDEIYDKILLDDDIKHYSLASLDDEIPIVTFNGLSKSHLVPGFRIGWGILSGKKELVQDYNEAIQKLVRARLSANHPEQFCIKNALLGKNEHINNLKNKLKKRRDLVYDRISKIEGLSIVKPQAAFYAFISMNLNVEDEIFAKKLIEKTGVVLVPGNGFGQREKSNHFRIVFLAQEEILNEALDLIENFIKNKAWLS